MQLSLDLQRRRPRDGKRIVESQSFQAHKLGIVIVDLWDWHWCKTASERVGALIPRMNKALECARQMGVQIFHCPTDGAMAWAGTPEREAALATPRHALPEPTEIHWPPGVPAGCMCGPGSECEMNFGWFGMCPDLVVRQPDLVAVGIEELYSTSGAVGLALWMRATSIESRTILLRMVVTILWVSIPSTM